MIIDSLRKQAILSRSGAKIDAFQSLGVPSVIHHG
jgi:hypothetical protein